MLILYELVLGLAFNAISSGMLLIMFDFQAKASHFVGKLHWLDSTGA